MRKWLLCLLLLPTALCSSCGPLQPGGWEVTVRGGIAASLYVNRRPVWATNLSEAPSVQLLASGVDAFPHQFSVPATIALEAGWNATDHLQPYAEYAFTYAQGQERANNYNGVNIRFIYGPFVTHSGYIGLRYYLRGYCLFGLGRFTPCLGFKTGTVWQRSVVDTIYIEGGSAQTPRLYESELAVSGGLQCGVQWWFSRCFSLYMQREFVVTCGFTPNRNIVLDPAQSDGITNINYGSADWIVSFPVTFGLRYNF